MMRIIIPLEETDGVKVIDIFNYYIENSYAAFPEQKLGNDFFASLLGISSGYPRIALKTENDELIAFAFLRPYSPIPVFRRVAEVTYFIKPEYTGQGIGKSILEYLETEARQMGIDSLLASISSLNEPSIKFHSKQNFIQCGRLQNIGKKFKQEFDVVLMQKSIQ